MATKQSFNPDRLSSQPPSEADFVAALSRYQDAHGLDNTAFAYTLAVSDSLWRHTKAGRLPLGFRLLTAGAEMISHSVYQAAESSLVKRKGLAA